MDKVENRYMFDTTALNEIVRNPTDEMNIYKSKGKGFEYYFTEIQPIESQKTISKVPENVGKGYVERYRAELSTDLLKLIAKLQTKYVGQIATLRHNRWNLDGTFEILPDGEGGAVRMFNDIVNDNDSQHYNDAMIALSAIANGCTLIVHGERRLFNKVNHHFPGRAIKYDEYMKIIRSSAGA